MSSLKLSIPLVILTWHPHDDMFMSGSVSRGWRRPRWMSSTTCRGGGSTVPLLQTMWHRSASHDQYYMHL